LGNWKELRERSQDMPVEFLRLMERKAESRLSATNSCRELRSSQRHAHLFSRTSPGWFQKNRDSNGRLGNEDQHSQQHGKFPRYLPFLGQTQILQGTKRADTIQFELPPIERGAIAWVVGMTEESHANSTQRWKAEGADGSR